MGKVKIIRENAFLNAARDIEIHIGKQVFNIQANKPKEIDLSEGTYTAFTKIDWIKSDPVSFRINNDIQVELRVKPFIKSKSYFIILGILPLINTVIFALDFPLIFWSINVILLLNFLYLLPYFTFNRSKYLKLEVIERSLNL